MQQKKYRRAINCFKYVIQNKLSAMPSLSFQHTLDRKVDVKTSLANVLNT